MEAIQVFPLCLCRIFPESLRWLMATQQFESAKKLILYITQKNCVSPESDIKGVMPGKYTTADRVPESWSCPEYLSWLVFGLCSCAHMVCKGLERQQWLPKSESENQLKFSPL